MENICDKELLYEEIYSNLNYSYYISDDFSEKFYIELAKLGFISVTHIINNKEYLFPEIQKEYAVLDFKNLHIPKKVKKLLKYKDSYSFYKKKYFNEIIECLLNYHKECWIMPQYLELLKKIKDYEKDSDFELLYFSIHEKDTNKIIAGEIGYRVKDVYVSLTGFSSREKIYNNYGKLQMVLLSQYLEDNGYRFWNLGHPYMQYKLDLGAKIYNRYDFLKKWYDIKEK